MKITPPSLKAFTLWCTDAAVEFGNGCLDGILIGSGGGVITVAQTDTTAPSKLIINGALGFLGGMGLYGPVGVQGLAQEQQNPESVPKL